MKNKEEELKDEKNEEIQIINKEENNDSQLDDDSNRSDLNKKIQENENLEERKKDDSQGSPKNFGLNNSQNTFTKEITEETPLKNNDNDIKKYNTSENNTFINSNQNETNTLNKDNKTKYIKSKTFDTEKKTINETSTKPKTESKLNNEQIIENSDSESNSKNNNSENDTEKKSGNDGNVNVEITSPLNKGENLNINKIDNISELNVDLENNKNDDMKDNINQETINNSIDKEKLTKQITSNTNIPEIELYQEKNNNIKDDNKNEIPSENNNNKNINDSNFENVNDRNKKFIENQNNKDKENKNDKFIQNSQSEKMEIDDFNNDNSTKINDNINKDNNQITSIKKDKKNPKDMSFNLSKTKTQNPYDKKDMQNKKAFLTFSSFSNTNAANKGKGILIQNKSIKNNNNTLKENSSNNSNIFHKSLTTNPQKDLNNKNIKSLSSSLSSVNDNINNNENIGIKIKKNESIEEKKEEKYIKKSDISSQNEYKIPLSEKSSLRNSEIIKASIGGISLNELYKKLGNYYMITTFYQNEEGIIKGIIPIKSYKRILHFINLEDEYNDKTLLKMIKSSYLYYLSKLIKKGNKIGLNDNKKMFDLKKKIKYILDNSKKEFLDENKEEEIINNENSQEICTSNIISNKGVKNVPQIKYSIEKYCDSLEAVYIYYYLITCIINERYDECIQKIKEIKSEESDNKVKKEIHILEKDSLLKNENLNKNVDAKINMIIPYRIFIFAILFLSMILFVILLFS